MSDGILRCCICPPLAAHCIIGCPLHDPFCVCGHSRSAHIYHEGACRPGHVCAESCTRFRDVHEKAQRKQRPITFGGVVLPEVG